MLDEILRKLSKVIGRYRPLGKAVSAFSALVVAIFGLDRPVMAYTVVGCCDLRKNEYCKGDDPSDWGCAGTWCWTCGTFRTTGPCSIFRCYECYGDTGPEDCFNWDCEGGSGGATPPSNIICSKSINIHLPCY